jgi:hypothetical protein
MIVSHRRQDALRMVLQALMITGGTGLLVSGVQNRLNGTASLI